MVVEKGGHLERRVAYSRCGRSPVATELATHAHARRRHERAPVVCLSVSGMTARTLGPAST